MPEILSVTFVIHEQWVADFKTAILINAQASLNNEPGCDRFDVCRDEKNPTVFYLYEIYHDKEAGTKTKMSEGFKNALEIVD